MIRRPPRSTQSRSSAASDVYKRQVLFRLHSRNSAPSRSSSTYRFMLGRLCPAPDTSERAAMAESGDDALPVDTAGKLPAHELASSGRSSPLLAEMSLMQGSRQPRRL